MLDHLCNTNLFLFIEIVRLSKNDFKPENPSINGKYYKTYFNECVKF